MSCLPSSLQALWQMQRTWSPVTCAMLTCRLFGLKCYTTRRAVHIMLCVVSAAARTSFAVRKADVFSDPVNRY